MTLQQCNTVYVQHGGIYCCRQNDVSVKPRTESCGNCPQQNNTYRPRPTVKTHIFGITFSIQRSLLQLLFPIFPTTLVVTLMYRLQYVPIQSFVCKKVPLTIL